MVPMPTELLQQMNLETFADWKDDEESELKYMSEDEGNHLDDD